MRPWHQGQNLTRGHRAQAHRQTDWRLRLIRTGRQTCAVKRQAIDKQFGPFAATTAVRNGKVRSRCPAPGSGQGGKRRQIRPGSGCEDKTQPWRLFITWIIALPFDDYSPKIAKCLAFLGAPRRVLTGKMAQLRTRFVRVVPAPIRKFPPQCPRQAPPPARPRRYRPGLARTSGPESQPGSAPQG